MSAIERLDRAGVERAVAWAGAEGWNPGVDDLDPFLAADPDGYFGARVDGQLAVTLSAIRYGTDFGFLGLYIAAPELRGHGLAYPVWRAAREYLAGRIVGLDAVVEQESTYARDGFVTASGTTRYALDESTGITAPANATVDARSLTLDTVVAYERALVPAERSRFLAAWLAMPSALARAVVDGDRLVGWGLRRRCLVGHKVGPLFADDADVADALWRTLVTDVEGPVFLDVPDPNAVGRALAARSGMAAVFSTRRMYDGPAPDLALDRVFGVTTLELG